MRTAIVLLTACFAGQAETLSQGERDRAMSHLHATRKMFIDSLTNVSEAQWKWKPGPDRWSIAEVAEHITLSEDGLFQLATLKVMKIPPDPAKRADRANDERIMKEVADRTEKAKAPAMLQPQSKWPTKQAMLDAFKERRDKTITYVKTTQEDLRAHAGPHPRYGLVDAYQWMLVIAAHTDRHVQQIEEVKASAGYPK
jgi:uncharacterized damage-inducible protein DinB